MWSNPRQEISLIIMGTASALRLEGISSRIINPTSAKK
jgi:hypothetical protein